MTLFLYAGLSVGIFFLALNLVQVQGYSKTQAGLATLPFSLLLTVLSRFAGRFMDRNGPRLPLIAGPSLAGLGFFWMAFSGLTRGPIDYWTAFMPGVILIGAGMGFTVAPLSTSVMGSVATPLFGRRFGGQQRRLAHGGRAGDRHRRLARPDHLRRGAGQPYRRAGAAGPVRQALLAEAGKLGGAAVPVEAGAQQAAAIAGSIQQSFVDAFRLVMFICAGLAWVSAVAAAWLIESKVHPA